MAGVDFSAFQVLWFMGAGFILGFATSTLWEWLYYRGKRRAQAAAAPLIVSPPARADNQISQPDETLDIQPDESWAMPYRGSGIYLESEHPSLAGQSASTPDTLPGTSLSASLFPIDEREDIDEEEMDEEEIDEAEANLSIDRAPLHTPRLNPATLAALQSAVAQSPIAHSATQSNVYPVAPDHDIAGPTMLAGDAPNDALPHEGDEDEIHVREIASYAAPPTALAPADDDLLDADDSDLDAGATAVKVVEILHIPPVMPTDHRTHRAKDYPDDLTLIKGVGEAYKRRLYGAGIYTWRQVAEIDTESLRHITRAKPNANIDDWRTQAQALAEKYQRWDTTFQGPLDDFTHIDSIGSITADTLYKAGLCTYEQLAAALPDELAKIVPAPTVGDEIDFESWINTAVQLANAKRHTHGSRA